MAKGSKSDPYTMAEYNEMLQNGTWKGGYVKDDNGNVSYTLPELVANGYSGSGSGSGSSSGNGSGSDFQFGSYKSFQGDPGLDDDDDDDEESGGNNGNNNQSSGGNGEYFGGGGGNSSPSIPDLSSKVTFSGYKEEDKSGCFRRCTEMLQSIDGLDVIKCEIAFMNCDNNGRTTTPTGHVQDGINYIDDQLKAGHPVIVAVDRKIGTSIGKTWADQAGDHFVIIVGGNKSVGYHYFDPGTAHYEKGTSRENVFKFSNGKFTSESPNNVKEKNEEKSVYTLTSLRKNNK